jgi:hypothetical protein
MSARDEVQTLSSASRNSSAISGEAAFSVFSSFNRMIATSLRVSQMIIV